MLGQEERECLNMAAPIIAADINNQSQFSPLIYPVSSALFPLNCLEYSTVHSLCIIILSLMLYSFFSSNLFLYILFTNPKNKPLPYPLERKDKTST